MTSDLSSELFFTLSGDAKHRGKVDSLISPIKVYKPKKMELWVFREYSQIQRALETSLYSEMSQSMHGMHFVNTSPNHSSNQSPPSQHQPKMAARQSKTKSPRHYDEIQAYHQQVKPRQNTNQIHVLPM